MDGKPVNTGAQGSKPSFASLFLILPSRALVERDGYSFEVNVSYEQLPDFCTHCSSVGHFVGDCRALKKMQEESNRNSDNRIKQQQKKKTQSPFKSTANPSLSANAGTVIPSSGEPNATHTFHNITSVETHNSYLFNAMPPPRSTINATTTLLTHPNSYVPINNDSAVSNHQPSENYMEPTLGDNAHINSNQ
ncbi:hypothetical protein LguiA_016906 [Lonicera macranthoides]